MKVSCHEFYMLFCLHMNYTKRRAYLRVFENRGLRTVFGSKREEVAGGCKRLHNEGLHNLYTSTSIMKIIK